MRIKRAAVFLSFFVLVACATQKLAVAPPAGVDFSGHWRLNEAESDDPFRLASGQAVDPSRATAGPGAGGQQGRGQRGGAGGGGFGGPGGAVGPVMPGVGALDDGLRWPGKDVEIKQVAGVVSMSSGGVNEVYQPRSTDMKPPHRNKAHAGVGDRDMPDRERGQGGPAVCGWDDKNLVVQGGDPGDDQPPYEERYSLSADGQQLIKVVSFKSGRSRGYTVSRTWDRVDPKT